MLGIPVRDALNYNGSFLIKLLSFKLQVLNFVKTGYNRTYNGYSQLFKTNKDLVQVWLVNSVNNGGRAYEL